MASIVNTLSLKGWVEVEVCAGRSAERRHSPTSLGIPIEIEIVWLAEYPWSNMILLIIFSRIYELGSSWHWSKKFRWPTRFTTAWRKKMPWRVRKRREDGEEDEFDAPWLFQKWWRWRGWFCISLVLIIHVSEREGDNYDWIGMYLHQYSLNSLNQLLYFKSQDDQWWMVRIE